MWEIKKRITMTLQEKIDKLPLSIGYVLDNLI